MRLPPVYQQPGICGDGCGKKRNTVYAIEVKGYDGVVDDVFVYCFFCLSEMERQAERNEREILESEAREQQRRLEARYGNSRA